MITFECGACNSRYMLEDGLFGKAGIKVTCPQCHAFYIFRSGQEVSARPIVEKLAEHDGAFEENMPAPLPGEKTTETILNDVIDSLSSPNLVPPKTEKPSIPETAESSDEISDISLSDVSEEDSEQHVFQNTPAMTQEQQAEYLDEVKPIEKPRNTDAFEPTGQFYDPDTIITMDSLSDYPADPPESQTDKVMVWLGVFGIVLSAILFLNYKSLLPIPGLDFLQEKNMQPIEQQQAPLPRENEEAETEQYGFPIIEELPDDK